MQEDLILLIGEKIKSKRTQKNITLEELANRAGVTKGLISQIENNRTVPSLPVLFNLIHSLGEDLKSFFEDMHEHFTNGHVLIVRKGEEKLFEKEPVKGFSYKRILTKSVVAQAIDIAVLELKKGAGRKQMIQTDAFECKHILKGSIEYQIEKEKFMLNAGDTLFFDGRAKHRLRNIGDTEATILVIYLF
ncbi:XRE family transcriptional regulator [Paraflavitalea soli]|uniref:XRE family transcriptional regulator n=1 Tax=Paraflavitalea soli TaxID=2315862 RepID=A0A3B7N5B9_9BACT|nr:XRE family transcriptional regulator [Paraflavitalea soli]AXY77281.1 XRE family transcriptional regulator [Paraflavitalea soli]